MVSSTSLGCEGSSLTGFIARPDLSRRDRRGIHLVINGRVVDDKRLQQAVIEGYRSVLEVGRFPVGVIYLETPDGFVDVNVHPQKTEVRLAQPRLLFFLLRESVMNRLASAPWLGLGEGRTSRRCIAQHLVRNRVEVHWVRSLAPRCRVGQAPRSQRGSREGTISNFVCNIASYGPAKVRFTPAKPYSGPALC